MIDMRIEAKSDQLNADDLIAGPKTIRIRDVRALAESPDQPIAIDYDGDGGKPWKPCKSMRRVLVAAWGSDARRYVGRRVTLYRDDSVTFGAQRVGGIRVSHLSDIESEITIMLTQTRGRRAPYRVAPLAEYAHNMQDSRARDGDAPRVEDYEACADMDTYRQLEARRAATWTDLPRDVRQALRAAAALARERLGGATSQDGA